MMTLRLGQEVAAAQPVDLGENRPDVLHAPLHRFQQNAAPEATHAHLFARKAEPGFIYRWYFGAGSLKSLKRNILGFVGIRPTRETLIGNIEGMSPEQRQTWLERMRELGRRAR